MRRVRSINNVKKKKTFNFIFLYIITTFVVVMFSASRYQSTYVGDNSVKVAKVVMNINSENPELTLNINPVLGEKVYNFNVENIKNDEKSDVSMEYILKLETFSNLPLEFKLYKEEDIEKNNNLLEGKGNATEKIILNVDEESHGYNLIVNWLLDENSYLYSNTIDYVQVILESEQRD